MPPVLGVLLVCVLEAVTWSSADATTPEEFGVAINVAGRQRMLTQRMSKEFFLVALGYKPDANKANLAGSIALFDSSLNNLINGAPELTIPPAPSANSLLELNKVKDMWLPFQAVLEDNVNLDPIPQAALDYVRSNNVPLLQQANRAVSRLVDASLGAGVATAGQQVDTAGRQRMLSQRMSKEVVMMKLGMDIQGTAAGLKGTMELFEASHMGLLRGQAFLGLAATTNRCVLQQMRTVSFIWTQFQLLIRDIAFKVQVPDTMLAEVAELNPTLLFEMNRAVGLYVSQPVDCPETASTAEWLQALRTLAFGQSMLWQCGRLFLQVALNVDVNEGTNTLQIRFTQSESYLRNALEGNQIEGIKTPATQQIVDNLIVGWNNWEMFMGVVRKSISYLPVESDDAWVAFAYGEVTFARIADGLQLFLDAADLAANLPVGTIGVISLSCRLSSLVELLVFQAFYTVYHGQASTAAGIVSVPEAIAEFVTTRDMLLEGRNSTVHLVNRTTDACILRHMQLVSNLWNRVAGSALRFSETSINNVSLSLLQELSSDGSQLFDPLLGVVDLYVFGPVNGCTLTTSVTEWEASLLMASFLRVFAQRAATELALEIRTVNRPSDRLRLWLAVDGLESSLRNLTFGSSSSNIPSPPTQSIADQLWVIRDLWNRVHDMAGLQNRDAIPTVPPLADETAFLQAVDALPGLYEVAALVQPAVQARRIIAAAEQSALVEHMTRDVTRLGPGEPDAPQRLLNGIEEFKERHTALLRGTEDLSRGDLGYMPPTLERPILPQMQITLDAFDDYARRIVSVVNEGYANDNVLSDVLFATEFVTTHTDQSARLYGISRTLASLVQAKVLTPLPLSGLWKPGPTMQVAVEIAQELINEQQLLLPGVELVTTVIDDQCDDRQAMRGILQKVTEQDASWVGLGGMACSSVCASTAIVAQSVNLPVVSYGCAASYLSDVVAYPGFARLGTALTVTGLLVSNLAAQFGWTRMEVLVDAASPHPQDADNLVLALREAGLSVQLQTVSNGRWEQFVAKAAGFLDQEVRNIFVLGNEDFMTTAACACEAAGITPGIAWLSSGLKRRSWFRSSMDLTQFDSRCTPAAVLTQLQGAINIMGTGQTENQSSALSCLWGYTPESFMTLFEERVAEMMVEGTFRAEDLYDGVAGLAADGVCSFAYMLKYMVDRGFAMSQLGSPTAQIYTELMDYIHHGLSFNGVSGNVTFDGNDKAGSMGLYQVQGNGTTMVGMVYINGTVAMDLNGGPMASSWTPHPPGPPPSEFPWLVVPVAIFAVVIVGAAAMGIRHGFKSARETAAQGQGQSNGGQHQGQVTGP